MFGEHVISRAVWLAHVRRRRRVGGARERASRCRRPGFHEYLNRRGVAEDRSGESISRKRGALGGLPSRRTLVEATTRFYLFGQRDLFDVYSTHTHARTHSRCLFGIHSTLQRQTLIPIVVPVTNRYRDREQNLYGPRRTYPEKKKLLT